MFDVERGTGFSSGIDESFDGTAIGDEQLPMMFSCCHPRLKEEVQVPLILNILCGFGGGTPGHRCPRTTGSLPVLSGRAR